MEAGQIELLKNPKRVIAGGANRRRRGPLTEAGRQRLREAALVLEQMREIRQQFVKAARES